MRYACRFWLAALGLAACSRNPEPSALPNVLLISLDTLRADRINAYGYGERELTPAIDALAADGILFEDCSSTSAWTIPAHASLFTSQFPSGHGMTQSLGSIRQQLEAGEPFSRLAESRTTLAELFRDAGYRTAAFTGGVTLDPTLGFDQGFERYETGTYKVGPEDLAQLAEWVDEAPGEPFFLFWHTFEVHTPFLDPRYVREVVQGEAAEGLVEAIDGLARGLAADPASRDGFGFKAPHVGTQRELLQRSGHYTPEVSDALYCGGVASADRWVGEIVRVLRERDLYDRTLVILTSDHGEELADHDAAVHYHSHGHQLYQELVHVPLVMKLTAGGPAGERVSASASLVDVMPTLVDLLSLPAGGTSMQGRSLRPLWEGGAPLERPVAMEALISPAEKKAIRSGRYKLILTIAPPRVERHGRARIPKRVQRELYDLEVDPLERRDLLSEGNGQHVALADELEARLRATVEAAAEDGRVDEVRVESELLEGFEALGYFGDDGDEE